MLSWKGPTRIFEFSPWLHTGPPQIQTLYLRVLSKRSLNSGYPGHRWPFGLQHTLPAHVQPSAARSPAQRSSAPLIPSASAQSPQQSGRRRAAWRRRHRSAAPGRAGGGGAPCGGRRVPAGPGRGRLSAAPSRQPPRSPRAAPRLTAQRKHGGGGGGGAALRRSPQRSGPRR